MYETLAAVVAKLAALPVAAKAAAGVTVAAATIGTAGVTGVLPEAADVTKPPAVEQSQQVVVKDAQEAQDVESDPATEDAGRPADAPELPEQAGFGQGVAEDARDGGVVGAEVAEQAKAAAQARRPATADGAQAPAAPAPQSDAGRQTAGESSGQEVPAGPAAGDEAAQSGADNADRAGGSESGAGRP